MAGVYGKGCYFARPDPSFRNDRSTVLASIAARLLVAGLDDDAGRARKLRAQALQTLTAQATGRNDPRLLALHIEALLGLDQRQAAIALLPMIWKTGYRDPAFAALLSREHVDSMQVTVDANTLR